MKKIIKVGLIVLSAIMLLGGIAAVYYFAALNPYRGTVDKFPATLDLDEVLTRDEAEEDLAYVYEMLVKRHPAWLDGNDAATQAAAVQWEYAYVSFDGKVTVLELYKACAKMAAQLNDGHTTVRIQPSSILLYIDDFTQFKDYGMPVTIGGISTEQLFADYKDFASYELEFYIRDRFENNIAMKTFLEILSLDTSNGIDMVFETPDGQQTFHYDFVLIEQVNGYEMPDVNTEDKWVYYEIDAENDIGIFTLETCKYNDEYKQVLGDFFEEVYANDINNVVVDLRYNGGGNSNVANEFIAYLNVDSYHSWKSAVRYGNHLHINDDTLRTNNKKPETFSGDVYIMMNHQTYSSAMDFAMLIGDNDLGTLVGQPSGNLPDSYGDILKFTTPNAHIAFTVSYKKWWRVDTGKAGNPIEPDYLVESRDALNKVYELVGGK